ncbi:tripartite tricarboxylate transporter TctB family protein [Roseinatronobacter monicus]|uniref:Tripartite tricarboxylate transporter TctB family protein n=1 Tax=Roseinatronobacter monicus TaxID=393481 RepID=A0A543K5V3_9RHOB|nr:tripartite tricarboxylate transporter TctB family protein [Roseinatronobacter monicus]TQM90445.1 tripartite tricarboxylate transporter TctB family protein [Roseinatronobacter monicus]
MKNIFSTAFTRLDFFTGLVTIIIGVVGLLDITYGNWRPGPGLGPHAFPQLAYITLIIAGLAIWIDVLRGKSDDPPENLRAILLTGVGLVAIGMGMFWLIGKLGLIVSVAATLIGASFLLTRHPFQHWPSTIVVPIIATAVIWVLFVQLINIPLPRGLLF